MEVPDVRQFNYVEGEIGLICRLLQNQQIDEILNRAESHLFNDGFCRNIFELCKEYAMDIGRGNVNYTDIIEILRGKGRADVQTVAYINQLVSRNTATMPTLDLVFDTLVKHSNHRRLVMHLYKHLTKAQCAGADVQNIIADAEDDLLTIEQGGKDKIEVILPGQITARRFIGLEQRRLIKPVYSDWADFDALLSHGFAPGKTSVIGGRTSMGKSFFKTNLMINMARKKVGVINICPEQGFDSEHDRIDSIMTGIHLRALTKLRDMPADEQRIRGKQLKAISEIIDTTWNYACVPSRNITVTGVQSAIRRAKRAGLTPQVVFIDLFDRLEDVNVADNRTANFSVKLNQISKIGDEEGVHMCLLVQISRKTEGRKEKRPEISDLRDCGNFEQDADLIMLLYREGYYNRDMEDNVLEVELAKQRDGIAGVTFQFHIMDKDTLSIMPMGVKRKVEAGGGQ